MFELVAILYRMNARLRAALVPMLRERGFSSSELLVLLTVLERGSFRPTELAKEAGVSASTFTGIVDRLVGKGLLVRETDPGDRRSIMVRGTPALLDKTKELKQECDAVIAQMLRNVPPELLEQTLSGLREVYEWVAADGEPTAL